MKNTDKYTFFNIYETRRMGPLHFIWQRQGEQCFQNEINDRVIVSFSPTCLITPAIHDIVYVSSFH